MGCRPPGPSVHGILQARLLEQVAISSSRGSSQPRNQLKSPALGHWQADRLPLSHQGSPRLSTDTEIWILYDFSCIIKSPLICFHSFTNVKIILYSWVITKQSVGRIVPTSHRLLISLRNLTDDIPISSCTSTCTGVYSLCILSLLIQSHGWTLKCKMCPFTSNWR